MTGRQEPRTQPTERMQYLQSARSRCVFNYTPRTLNSFNQSFNNTRRCRATPPSSVDGPLSSSFHVANTPEAAAHVLVAIARVSADRPPGSSLYCFPSPAEDASTFAIEVAAAPSLPAASPSMLAAGPGSPPEKLATAIAMRLAKATAGEPPVVSMDAVGPDAVLVGLHAICLAR